MTITWSGQGTAQALFTDCHIQVWGNTAGWDTYTAWAAEEAQSTNTDAQANVDKYDGYAVSLGVKVAAANVGCWFATSDAATPFTATSAVFVGTDVAADATITLRATIKGIADLPVFTAAPTAANVTAANGYTADTGNVAFTSFSPVGTTVITADSFNYVAKYTPIESSVANFRYQKDLFANAWGYSGDTTAWGEGTAVALTGAFAATSVAALSVAAALAF